MRILRRTTAAVAALLVAGSTAHAQGLVSVQGLGYPQGQLSTRALSTGGATAESDPLTPINPAAILLVGSGTIVGFQLEPEWRNVTAGGRSGSTNIARYPLTSGIVTIGSRFALGVSFSSLLDRTFITNQREQSVLATDTVAFTARTRSDGGITDVRLAVAARPTSWLRVGAAIHGYTGENRVTLTRIFEDTTRFQTLGQRTETEFRGQAFSVGAELRRDEVGAIAVAYRAGNGLRLLRGDSVVGRADVPDRFSISASVLALRGAVLAVRAAQDKWSALAPVVNSTTVRDTWDYGAGADVFGPRIGRTIILLRAGVRARTLPFGVGSAEVTERSFSGGTGFALGGGRGVIDASIARARRSGGGASENAWVASVGISVRP